MRGSHGVVAIMVVSVLVIGSSRTARADDEVGALLMVLIAPLALPLGTVLVAGPFFAASAVAGGGIEMAPRPTGGSFRVAGVFPFGDRPFYLFRIDLGGYPKGGASLGWEGRCDVTGSRSGPLGDAVQVRWDGLSLWRLTPLKAPMSVEMLGGITVWPTFGAGGVAAWTGGGLGGVRLGARTGGGGWLRLESEVAGRLLFGAHSRGLDTQIDLRLGASVHVRYRAPLQPARTVEASFGVAYLGALPVASSPLLPSTHLWVWTMSL